jgi:serine/threonine-protein kinase
MRLAPGARLGPYEVLRLVGTGGMGEVYRARDTRLDRTVAIKIIRGGSAGQLEVRQRFDRETRIISQLTHPHICALYDVGDHDGCAFFVMEYVDGETLSAKLARGPLPLRAGLAVMVEIAEALAFAHRVGIIHRDLTPNNIMLTRAGAKLLDFGLAKLTPFGATAAAADTSTSPALNDLTTDGALLGTLRYMAPEVLDGREADARSDIFAFGAVLYEVVTGRKAFPGGSHARVVSDILSADPPPMAIASGPAPALERLVRACLAKQPDDRWQHASDLVRELQWILEDDRPLSTGSWRARLTHLPPASRRTAIGAGVLALAVAAGAVALWPRAPMAAATRHLVVLPCRPIGGSDADQRYCDGLASALTARLAALAASHGLHVTPAADVHNRQLQNAAAARRELGATLTLEGSFMRQGSSLRVVYALVDAVSLAQRDAVSFTAPADDPFALQDRVIEWALSSLRVTLGGPEQALLTRRETREPGAYEYYLQGRGYLLDFHRAGSVDTAIELFRRGLGLDAQHALSHAGLGDAYWLKYEETRDETWIDQARAACTHAAALDPDLAAAHVCLGILALGTGHPDAAVTEFETALRADPASDAAYLGLARAQERLGQLDAAEQTYLRAVAHRPAYWASRNWLGNFYRMRGRYYEALRQYEQAVQLTPDNALAWAFLGGVYTLVGRYDEAAEASRRSVALAPTVFAYGNWGMTLYRQRRFGEAVDMLERARQLRSDFRTVSNLARATYWRGDRARARQLYAEAIALTRKELAVNPRNPDFLLQLAESCAKIDERVEALAALGQTTLDDPHLQHFAAMTYLTLGETATALDLLRRARAGLLPVAELHAWIDLDPLRTTSAFAELVR